MKEMKQNKNSSVVLRVASATLAAVFLFCSLSFPSFAVSVPDVDDFSNQPLPVVSIDSTWSTADKANYIVSYGLLCGTVSANGGGNKQYYACDMENVYILNSPDRVFLASESDLSSVHGYLAVTSSAGVVNTSTVWTSLNNQVYDESTHLYYRYFSNGSGMLTSYIASAQSTASCLSLLRDFLDSSSGGGGLFDQAHVVDYPLEAGNVAFIDITNINATFTFSISTYITSWTNTALQYYGVLNQIPQSFSVPLSGTSIINWQGTGKSDFLGRYNTFSFSGSASGSASGHNHVYLVVVNPLSQLATNNSDGTISPSGGNPTINIHVSSANGIRVFNLKETFSYGAPSAESSGSTYTGHVDLSTGDIYFTNDQTGEVENPAYGGDSLVDTATTTINDFLQRIATTISSFFTGAIGAVSTLVSAGSAFINQLISLYSWLPAPVYAVLSSALIIVITIGVIKVFV